MKENAKSKLKKRIQIEKDFKQLLEDNKALIIKIAAVYFSDPEDQQDLVQEIAIQLWRSFPRYDSNYALSTWIYRIALNTSITYLRKQKTRQKHMSRLADEKTIISWNEEDNSKEYLKELYRLIENLNPAEKALIILHLDSRSNEEVASIMGISKSNVSTRLNRIKIKLQQLNQKK